MKIDTLASPNRHFSASFPAPAPAAGPEASGPPCPPAWLRPPALVACVDRNLRYLSVTEGVETHIGLRAEQIVGRTNRQLGLPPELALLLDASLQSVLDSGLSQEIEILFPCPTGRRAFQCRILPETGAGGRIETLLLAAWDLAPSPEPARRLEKSLHKLLERTLGAVLQMDLQGRLLHCNAAAGQLFGWSAREAVHPALDEFFAAPPGRFSGALHEVLQSGAWSGLLAFQDGAGQSRTVHSHWMLLEGRQGGPGSILVVSRPCSGEPPPSARSRRAQRQAGQAALASGMERELAALLDPAPAAMELIRARLETAEELEALDLLCARMERAGELARHLRTFAEGARLAARELDPRSLLEDLEHILRQSFPRQMTLRIHAPGQLWPVLADAAQLREALLELCVNSRDAMDGTGALTVRAANLHLDAPGATQAGLQPGAHVLLEITDQGPGMEETVLERVFDPFFTTRPETGARGLGLARVQAIIQAHGGMVSVRSSPGAGTTVRVLLPARPTEGAGSAGQF